MAISTSSLATTLGDVEPVGRFGGWPSDRRGMRPANNASELTFPFESDLISRVHADRILRSHKSLNHLWELGFSASDSLMGDLGGAFFPNLVDNEEYDTRGDLVTEARTQIYKQFAVTMNGDTSGWTTACEPAGGASYSVGVSSVAPGTRIMTDHDVVNFTLRHPTKSYYKNAGEMDAAAQFGFTHVVHVWKGNTIVSEVDPGGTGASLNIPEKKLEGGWALLIDAVSGSEEHLPVLLSFSSNMKRLIVEPAPGNSAHADFNGGESGTRTVAFSFPFGVGSVDAATMSSWLNGDPSPLAIAAATTHALVSARPDQVDESYTLSGTETDAWVDITSTFSGFIDLDGNAVAPTEFYAPLPPVLMLGRSLGIDSTIPPTVVESVFPTRHGEYAYQPGSGSVSYSIPAMPSHDIHLVRRDKDTVWQQRVTWASTEEQKQFHYLRQGAWLSAVQRGVFATLPQASGYVRGLYNQAGEFLIRDHILNIEESGISKPPTVNPKGQWRLYDWTGSQTPCNSSYPDPDPFFGLHWRGFEIPQSYPAPITHDIDATSGAVLAHIYEYALVTGNWDLVSDVWDQSAVNTHVGIRDLMLPLVLLQDWAWMLASGVHTSATGTGIDMIVAQIAAYHSMAQMAKIVGQTADYELASYLGAKAQIAIAARWGLSDYAAQFYSRVTTPGTQITSGYAEYDPFGPLQMDWRNLAVESWADWMVSGEIFHPIVHEMEYALLGGNSGTNPFLNTLGAMAAQAGTLMDPASNPKVGSFADNKLYLFGRFADALQVSFSNLESWSNGLLTPAEDFSFGNYGPIFEVYRHYPRLENFDWFGVGGPSASFTPPNLNPVVGDGSLTHPIVAGTVESYGLPVRVGGWGPALLKSAKYSVLTNTFTANLVAAANPPVGVTPSLWLSVDQTPLSLTVDAIPVPIQVDRFGACKAELTGPGPWTVVATFASNSAPTPAPTTTVDGNRYRDGGMEFYGATKPLYHSSYRIGSGWTTHFAVEDSIVASGDLAMRAGLPSSQGPYGVLRQAFYVKPGTNFDISLKYFSSTADLEPKILVDFAPVNHGLNAGTSAGDPTGYWTFARWGSGAPNSYSPTPGLPTGVWHQWDIPGISMPADAGIAIVYIKTKRLNGATWSGSDDHYLLFDDVYTGVPPSGGGGGGTGDKEPDPTEYRPTLAAFRVTPNPFQEATTFAFTLGASTKVRLKIYDLRGRLVRTVGDDVLPPGQHMISWDGRDERGQSVASGAYVYRFEAAGKMRSDKIVHLR